MGAGKGKADPIDAHVGSRLRAFRLQAGMNQTELARALGVTFQQVQKYEKGVNRVSASMLARASQALHCKIDAFFPDDATGADAAADVTAAPRGREMLAILASLDPKRRDILMSVAREMAKAD